MSAVICDLLASAPMNLVAVVVDKYDKLLVLCVWVVV